MLQPLSAESKRSLPIFSIAVKLANDLGYNIAVITGANNKGIEARLNRLGVKNVFLNSNDKVKDLLNYSKTNNINLKKTVYMGDDLPDTFPMELVYLKTCPHDAAPEVREISDYISNKKGGEGCVRDIIEQTLKVQGNWDLSKKNQRKLLFLLIFNLLSYINKL